MLEANNPEINVAELMQKIRKEVAKHHSSAQHNNSDSVTVPTSTANTTHIEALLRNAESRAYVRTSWPDQFNCFPFNLTQKLQKVALKVLALLFRDQREVNFGLIQALRESVALNQQLTTQITALQSQMNERLESVNRRVQGAAGRLDAVENAVDSRVQGVDQHLDVVNSRIQGLHQHLGIVDSQVQGVDQHLDVVNSRVQEVDSRVQVLDEHYLKNDNYLKNDLLQQKRLISLFLEEARQRLPEPFNQEQLQTFVCEDQHLLDALYAAFEEQFRGSRENIRDRLRVYLPLIEEAEIGTPESPILDVGCGRGEWLELLQESRYVARGIDINRVMLEQCRVRGLEVFESDVITYMQSLPSTSIGAVTGFHIIEHLPFRVLIKLLDETIRVLKPGGLAIFETPNPENIVVGSCNFYADPTHRNPLFPPTVKFLFEQRGFVNTNLIRLSEHRLKDTLEMVDADNPIAPRLNPLIEIAKLRFYASPDFAVTGRKA